MQSSSEGFQFPLHHQGRRHCRSSPDESVWPQMSPKHCPMISRTQNVGNTISFLLKANAFNWAFWDGYRLTRAGGISVRRRPVNKSLQWHCLVKKYTKIKNSKVKEWKFSSANLKLPPIPLSLQEIFQLPVLLPPPMCFPLIWETADPDTVQSPAPSLSLQHHRKGGTIMSVEVYALTHRICRQIVLLTWLSIVQLQPLSLIT